MPLSRVLASLCWFVSGVALALVSVVVVGILTVQTIGLRGGAVFDLFNTVVAVQPASVPLVPLAAIAIFTSAVILLLVFAVRELESMRWVPAVVGLALGLAVLVIVSAALGGFGRIPEAMDALGVPPGLAGWIDEGGGNSAIHVLLLVTMLSPWMFRDRGRNLSESGEAKASGRE